MMGGSGEKWKKSKPSKYTVEGGELVRKGVECPKCGPGVFMGEHSADILKRAIPTSSGIFSKNRHWTKYSHLGWQLQRSLSQ